MKIFIKQIGGNYISANYLIIRSDVSRPPCYDIYCTNERGYRQLEAIPNAFNGKLFTFDQLPTPLFKQLK